MRQRTSTIEREPTTRPRRKRRLLLPALLAVTLVSGGSAVISGCSDDDGPKNDTVAQHDARSDVLIADGATDSGPDLPQV